MGSGRKEREKAAAAQAAMEEQMRLARKEFKKVKITPIEARRILIDKYMPELQEELVAEQLGSSAMEDIAITPELKDAQMAALEDLQQIGERGYTDEDRATREALLSSVSAQEKARQAGILQSAAQRGMLDSGASLAAQLGSSQSSTQRAREEALQIAASQAQARREALSRAGQLGTQMRGQEFGEESKIAGAKDVINRFNLAQRQHATERNVGERQRLQENQQSIRRQQEMHNKALHDRLFEERMAKARGMAGASTNLAQMYGQRASAYGKAAAQKKAATYGLIGSAVGTGVGAFAGNPAMGAQMGGQMGSQVGAMRDGGVNYKDGGVEPTRSEGYVGVDSEYPQTHPSKISEIAIKEIAKIAKQYAPEKKKYSDGGLNLGFDKPNSGGLDFGLMPEETPAMKKPEKNMTGEFANLLYNKLKKPSQEELMKESDKQLVQQIEEQSSLGPQVDRGVKYKNGGVESTRDGGYIGVDSEYPTMPEVDLSKLTMEELDAIIATHPKEYAEGGTKYDSMGYEEGGLQTEGRIVPGENYYGDELDDKINSGEMVLNLNQQERLNRLLQEKNRLDSMEELDALRQEAESNEEGDRVDNRLEREELGVNRDQQEALMEVLRGERYPEDLPNQPIVEDGEKAGMSLLMEKLGMDKS